MIIGMLAVLGLALSLVRVASFFIIGITMSRRIVSGCSAIVCLYVNYSLLTSITS